MYDEWIYVLQLHTIFLYLPVCYLGMFLSDLILSVSNYFNLSDLEEGCHPLEES